MAKDGRQGNQNWKQHRLTGAYTTRKLRYRLVFVPKYRKRVLQGQVAIDVLGANSQLRGCWEDEASAAQALTTRRLSSIRSNTGIKHLRREQTLEHACLTHLALHVRDLEASVEFYQKFTALRVVERHSDSDSTGLNVVWLSEGEKDTPPQFVLVLLEGTPLFPPNAQTQTPLGPLSHLGFGLPSRQAVDAIAAYARESGILRFGATFLNENAGYICVVADPDGHNVEFSHGQALGPFQG